jgi:hypothetical protein
VSEHDPDNHDYDHDHNPGPANDNSGRNPDRRPGVANDNGSRRPAAPPPTGAVIPKTTAGLIGAGAIIPTTMEQLSAAMPTVDTSSTSGHNGKPMALFKSRMGGIWTYGVKNIAIELGTRVAINPLSFRRGWAFFNNDNKCVDRMASLFQPEIEYAALPDLGFQWSRQWSVEMTLISGMDAGIEVIFKSNTDGGVKMLTDLVNTIRTRAAAQPGRLDLVPTAALGKDGYTGPYGYIITPALNDIQWTTLGEGDSAPPPSPPQPSPPPPASPSKAEPTPRRRQHQAA